MSIKLEWQEKCVCVGWLET